MNTTGDKSQTVEPLSERANISVESGADLFPPSWDHEAFFALSGVSATLGLLSCSLCSLVLVRGPRQGVISQLLNSLVRADALFCLPMFVRAVAVAWDDWMLGDLMCMATSYLNEALLSVRSVMLLLLVVWHLVGHTWADTTWDGVVFTFWLIPMGSGLVALLDARVVGTAVGRVCSPFGNALPLSHHVWYVTAVLVPAAALVPLVPLTLVWRRRCPLGRTHQLPLVLVLSAVQLVCGGGALVLIWAEPPPAAAAMLVPTLVCLPLLVPTLNLPAFFWRYPQFKQLLQSAVKLRDP